MTKPATLQKVVPPIAPVPLLQVNHSTTTKTPLRHLSEPNKGHPRYMIKRYVRITYDPKSRPKPSLKCSPFKQIRVEPLRHCQDTLMTKLEDIQDRYKGDMSRLDKICQESLRNQKVVQTSASSVLPSNNQWSIISGNLPIVLLYKLEAMEDIQSQDMSRLSKDMSRSFINQKLGQNYYFKCQNYCQILWEDPKDLLGFLLNASII